MSVQARIVALLVTIAGCGGTVDPPKLEFGSEALLLEDEDNIPAGTRIRVVKIEETLLLDSEGKIPLDSKGNYILDDKGNLPKGPTEVEGLVLEGPMEGLPTRVKIDNLKPLK
jgi:hypothetical protein